MLKKYLILSVIFLTLLRGKEKPEIKINKEMRLFFTLDTLKGLYPEFNPKFIPKEEILKLNYIDGKYYTVYYSKEMEEKAKYAYEILNKGDSIIKEITGLEELVKFNIIFLDTVGNFYTDLPFSSILTKDLTTLDITFKEKIFTEFHEKIESILDKCFDLYKDKTNRFVGDGLAELIRLELMALFWPENFYRLSQIFADCFGSSNKVYNLANWRIFEPEDITFKAIESTRLAVPEEWKFYYVAPYFWAKIIDKSKNPSLIKDFIKELRNSKDRSQKGVIKILERLTRLNIKKELKISAEEIYNNICKYWYFIKVPLDMVVIWGPSEDSIILDEAVNKKFVITYPFLIDKYEVSNEEFCNFLNANGNKKEGGSYWLELDCYPEIEKIGNNYVVKKGREKYPVRWVSWYGAKAFALWKNKRLPTEAEWKKAAQGRMGLKYSFSRGKPEIWDSTKCNWGDEGKFDGYEYTAPVFAYEPSIYGCYNLVGNVMEWVEDWYGPAEKLPIINPKGDSGIYKVHVGGCFKYKKEWQTTYSRIAGLPNASYSGVGFRCAKDLPTIEEMKKEKDRKIFLTNITCL
jgi:hypothetical protein